MSEFFDFYGNPVIENGRKKVIRFPWTEVILVTDESDFKIDRVMPYFKSFREAYEKGKCFCICECSDTTLFEDGTEIWQNHNLIKIFSNDPQPLGMLTEFYADRCPICGKPLPTVDGGKKSNGFKTIKL